MIEISKNTIKKCVGHGIKLFNVKSQPFLKDLNPKYIQTLAKSKDDELLVAKGLFKEITGFAENIVVSENMIYDLQGFGVILDTSSCIFRNSKLEKCYLGGISVRTDEYIKLPKV